MTYRPLPDTLTIKNSEIEGLGLFATKDIEADTNLGVIHVYGNDNEIIRTPLGGFINHAKFSNTYKVKITRDGITKSYLYTKRTIKAGDELTLTYDLYKIN